MDRAPELRLYYSSSVGFRILPPKYNFYEIYIFIFSFSYQPFQCVGRNDTFYSANTCFLKDTLTVDKAYDESHRLHAAHLVPFCLPMPHVKYARLKWSVYCGHKQKTSKQTPNYQTKKQIKNPKRQTQRINKNVSLLGFESWTS